MMEDEDRRILVDEEEEEESQQSEGRGVGVSHDELSVGLRPCEANCLSIVHLASIVAAIGMLGKGAFQQTVSVFYTWPLLRLL